MIRHEVQYSPDFPARQGAVLSTLIHLMNLLEIDEIKLEPSMQVSFGYWMERLYTDGWLHGQKENLK